MGEKEQDKGKAKSKGVVENKKKGSFRFILLMVLIGGLIPLGVPTLILGLGLLPTLVAFFTDTSPRRYSFMTIGFMNIAGVAPFVVALWQRGHTVEESLRIMSQPITWLVMFGAAAIGQLLLYTIPPFVTMITANRLENRLEMLKEARKKLVEIWGEEVAENIPIDEIRRRLTR